MNWCCKTLPICFQKKKINTTTQSKTKRTAGSRTRDLWRDRAKGYPMRYAIIITIVMSQINCISDFLPMKFCRLIERYIREKQARFWHWKPYFNSFRRIWRTLWPTIVSQNQPKECKESGRKRLYMLGSRATSLVTAPWRIDCVLLLRTPQSHFTSESHL